VVVNIGSNRKEITLGNIFPEASKNVFFINFFSLLIVLSPLYLFS
jgi:hypothetical protein